MLSRAYYRPSPPFTLIRPLQIGLSSSCYSMVRIWCPSRLKRSESSLDRCPPLAQLASSRPICHNLCIVQLHDERASPSYAACLMLSCPSRFACPSPRACLPCLTCDVCLMLANPWHHVSSQTPSVLQTPQKMLVELKLPLAQGPSRSASAWGFLRLPVA